MPRNRHIVPLAIIGLIVAAVTVAQALLIDWLPPEASEQAGRTNGILWFLFWASAALFTIVLTVLIYSMWRFRAAPGDDSEGPPVHGNTLLEIIWTAVPTVLLLVTGVYGWIVLNRNEAVAADRLTVDVYAEQFAWSFGYPEAEVESGDLRLPQGRQVQLNLRARDVIHDFWVPEFGIKGDAVPGIIHTLYINPTKVGTFPVICAELCGLGHSVMRSRAVVMPAAEYDAWLAEAKVKVAGAPAPGSGGPPPIAIPPAAPGAPPPSAAAGSVEAGEQAFVQACQGCHPAGGNEAGVGPKLTGAGLTNEEITSQIVNGGGGMPAGLVQGEQLADVVAYVTSIQ